MPRGDQSGPGGRGPMTGRGAGYCNGFNQPGLMNCERGQQFGRGRGGQGRGFGQRTNFGMRAGVASGSGYNDGNRFNAGDKQETLQDLKMRANSLAQEVENIHTRIEKIEAEKNTD